MRPPDLRQSIDDLGSAITADAKEHLSEMARIPPGAGWLQAADPRSGTGSNHSDGPLPLTKQVRDSIFDACVNNNMVKAPNDLK
jgi:hypothetical protein